MAEIKSTLEKVLERAALMGRATQEEIATEERVKDGMIFQVPWNKQAVPYLLKEVWFRLF